MTLYKPSVLLSEVYCTMKQLSFLFVKSTLKTLKSIHKNKEENQGKVTLQILFAYSWSARSILSSLGSLLYLCVYLNSTLSEKKLIKLQLWFIHIPDKEREESDKVGDITWALCYFQLNPHTLEAVTGWVLNQHIYKRAKQWNWVSTDKYSTKLFRGF